MSWETAISGCFKLSPSLPKEEADDILKELKDLLEIESLELDCGVYYFKSLNFTSHVEPEKVKEKLQGYKNKVLAVSLNIWFLHEPDCHLEIRESKIEYETSIL